MPNTTSFELSKQLFEVAKSKGVELPLFTNTVCSQYIKQFNEKHIYFETNNIITRKENPFENDLVIINEYPSYTTDELLAWLPPCSHVWKWIDGSFLVDNKKFPLPDNIWCDTPSNALCKLAIYLIENDLLK